MSTILAFDPGAVTGWAWLADGELQGCGHFRFTHEVDVRQVHPIMRGSLADRLIIEIPQVYQGSKDPSALIKVALIAGALGALHPAPEFVIPHRWKGNVPKPIHNARVLAMLTSGRERVSTDHNEIDAVGLALWAEGRMKK